MLHFIVVTEMSERILWCTLFYIIQIDGLKKSVFYYFKAPSWTNDCKYVLRLNNQIPLITD